MSTSTVSSTSAKSSKKNKRNGAPPSPDSSSSALVQSHPAPDSSPDAIDVAAHVPPAPESAGGTRDAKLPRARKMERKVDYLVKCLAGLQREVKGWGAGIEVSVGESLDAINAAKSAVAALPDTFAPPKAAPGEGRNVKPLAVGDLIDITDKRMPVYADSLEPADCKKLKVTKVAGAMVSATTASGVKCILQRGHVAPHKG